MKRTTRAALALVLACGLCVQLSAQSATSRPDGPRGVSHSGPDGRLPVPSTHALWIHEGHPVLTARAGGNPPAPVRQPGSKTRMIVAIVAVASLVTLGVLFHDGR
jgi:hypothetical protein